MIRKFESCKLFLDLINSMVILMYKIYVWCIYDNFLWVSFFFYMRLLIYFYMILFILFIFWKSYEILLINNEIVFIRNKK